MAFFFLVMTISWVQCHALVIMQQASSAAVLFNRVFTHLFTSLRCVSTPLLQGMALEIGTPTTTTNLIT